MKKLFYLIPATILLLTCVISCEEEENEINEITIISEISNLTASPGDKNVLLNWTEPSDSSFNHVELSYIPGNDSTRTIPGGTTNILVTNLTNDTEYTFTLIAVYANDEKTNGVSISATPSDISSPYDVTDLRITSMNEKVFLQWVEPANADFAKVKITYSPDGDTPIYIDKGTTEDTITGLTNGTEYTFTVKTIDSDDNESEGVTIKATPDLIIEGIYTIIHGDYYRIGVLTDTFQVGYTALIEQVNETTYVWSDWGYPAGWIDNQLYFQIAEDGTITYPAEWDGVTQTLNGQLLTTCELNPDELSNVDCANSNYVIPDNVNDKHQLIMTHGYYTAGSGPREFYFVLEKMLIKNF